MQPDWATLLAVISGVAFLARKIGTIETVVKDHARLVKQVGGHETRLSRIEGRHLRREERNGARE